MGRSRCLQSEAQAILRLLLRSFEDQLLPGQTLRRLLLIFNLEQERETLPFLLQPFLFRHQTLVRLEIRPNHKQRGFQLAALA